MAKQFELPEWEQAALEHMKRHASGDGPLGYAVVDNGAEGQAWWTYFRERGMNDKGYMMRSMVKSKRSYMVPSRWPHEFDASVAAPSAARESFVHRSHPDRGKD